MSADWCPCREGRLARPRAVDLAMDHCPRKVLSYIERIESVVGAALRMRELRSNKTLSERERLEAYKTAERALFAALDDAGGES